MNGDPRESSIDPAFFVKLFYVLELRQAESPTPERATYLTTLRPVRNRIVHGEQPLGYHDDDLAEALAYLKRVENISLSLDTLADRRMTVSAESINAILARAEEGLGDQAGRQGKQVRLGDFGKMMSFMRNMHAHDRLPLIAESLLHLPDIHLGALLLRTVVGLSTEETGESLGMKAGTVRVACHRALARLHSVMPAHEVDQQLGLLRTWLPTFGKLENVAALAQATEDLRTPDVSHQLDALGVLEDLAQQDGSYRQYVVDLLCELLRTPQNDIQVRMAAQDILERHLRQRESHGQSTSTFWPDMDVNLTAATLVNANLTACRFRRAVFNRTTFQGDTSFESATFSEKASFNQAVFTHNAWFTEVDFSDHATFRMAKFDGDVSFEGSIHRGIFLFRGSTIHGKVRFVRSSFVSMYFVDSEVRGSATFAGATFRKSSSFAGSRFKSSTTFDDADFLGHADFEHVSFVEDPSFESVNFFGSFNFASMALDEDDSTLHAENSQTYYPKDLSDPWRTTLPNQFFPLPTPPQEAFYDVALPNLEGIAAGGGPRGVVGVESTSTAYVAAMRKRAPGVPELILQAMASYWQILGDLAEAEQWWDAGISPLDQHALDYRGAGLLPADLGRRLGPMTVLQHLRRGSEPAWCVARLQRQSRDGVA